MSNNFAFPGVPQYGPQPYAPGVPQAQQYGGSFGNGSYGAGTTVGNFGQVAQANSATGAAGLTGAGPGDPYVAPNNKGPAPQLGLMQDYGDYQNFGTIAQQYGAQGAGQLNTPAITNALGQTQLGAQGRLTGQVQQNQASNILNSAAMGNTASQRLLASAAQGNQPSAAEIQQRQGIQQGVANAAAMGASTRGNFGLANASRNAMAAEARGANEIAAGGAATRANEMAAARQAYAGAQGQAQGQYGQAAAAQAQNNVLAASQNYGAQAQNQGTNLGYLTGQQAAYQNQGNTALGAAEAQGNLDIGQAAQNMQQQVAQNQLTQGYVSGGTQAAAGLIGMAALAGSDERIKRDIRPAMDVQDAPSIEHRGMHPESRGAEPMHHRPAGEIMSQLDHFNPVSFHYKAAHDTPNQQAADAPQVGVLAQDVERGPAGRMLVAHAPDGTKMLHIPSMVGVMAAGEGALKARGDDHEARLARLERLLRAA